MVSMYPNRSIVRSHQCNHTLTVYPAALIISTSGTGDQVIQLTDMQIQDNDFAIDINAAGSASITIRKSTVAYNRQAPNAINIQSTNSTLIRIEDSLLENSGRIGLNVNGSTAALEIVDTTISHHDTCVKLDVDAGSLLFDRAMFVQATDAVICNACEPVTITESMLSNVTRGP